MSAAVVDGLQPPGRLRALDPGVVLQVFLTITSSALSYWSCTRACMPACCGSTISMQIHMHKSCPDANMLQELVALHQQDNLTRTDAGAASVIKSGTSR